MKKVFGEESCWLNCFKSETSFLVKQVFLKKFLWKHFIKNKTKKTFILWEKKNIFSELLFCQFQMSPSPEMYWTGIVSTILGEAVPGEF